LRQPVLTVAVSSLTDYKNAMTEANPGTKYQLVLKKPSPFSDWEQTEIVRMDGERAIGMDGKLVAERLPDGTWTIMGSYLVGKLTPIS
jgi:hypothetical protein